MKPDIFGAVSGVKWKPFSPSEVAAVREAITRAKEDMAEWRRLTRADVEKTNTHGNPAPSVRLSGATLTRSI